MPVAAVREILPSMMERCQHVPALLAAKVNRHPLGTTYGSIRLTGEAMGVICGNRTGPTMRERWPTTTCCRWREVRGGQFGWCTNGPTEIVANLLTYVQAFTGH